MGTRIDDLYRDINEFAIKWAASAIKECFRFTVEVVKTPFCRDMIHDARQIVDKADDILQGR